VRRLRRLAEELGTPGILGVGVLLFCALFYFSGVRPLEREVQAQQAAAERLKARTPLQLVSRGDRGEDLRRFHALFPTIDQLPRELDRVYTIARTANLQVQQGEYRLDARGPGLIAYRVTFPIRGTYGQLRQFVDATLKEMSTVSLETLRFERKKAGDTQLEAQVRLTMHFRPNGEAAYRPAPDTEEAK
jgi:hypothetical protein